MRPSILKILLIAGCVCECRAGSDVVGELLRWRTGITSSIVENGATSTHLELRATASPEALLPTSTGLVCSTTTQQPTSTCSLFSGKQICTETSTPVAFCKQENVCFTDKDGQDTCRLRNNNVAPAGIAFAVIVPSVLALIAVTLIIMRRRERKAIKRQRVIRTMERDALNSNRAISPRFEKYERVMVRGHGTNAEANAHLMEGDEEYPPPAYSKQSFDAGSSEQRSTTRGVPKIVVPLGDEGDEEWRENHEQRR